MKIDPDADVEQMLETWVNGNRSDVFAALKNDHPGLTGLFLLQGIRGKRLTQTDCNVIVNTLIGDRVEKLAIQDRVFPPPIEFDDNGTKYQFP